MSSEQTPRDAGTRRPFADGHALPLLLDLMRAAGHHDRDECLRLLDAIEPTLGQGPHKSRPDLDAARAAAAAGDWVLVHRSAWAATCGLTWAFPADPSVCPPVPRETPWPRTDTTCACGQTIPSGGRFCSACGTPVA